ncbi:MAG: hypothetical protein Q9207_006873 [Kuettlingeria erythrocarpa]
MPVRSYQVILSKPRESQTSQLVLLPSTGQASIIPAIRNPPSRTTVRSDRILDVTRQCVALFGRACSDGTLDASTRADIDNQLGRFKIWAGTIGVFAAGKASTDARLRDDADVKDMMIDLLLRLRRAIDAFLKPVLIEEDNDEQASEPTDSSDESEASLVLSIGGESSATTVESRIPSHHAATLRDIDSTISRLYRLSAIIRKPTSLQENARVASFIEKVDDGPDASEFKFHVRWQIDFRFPDASDAIVDRLASAVLFRRRKLLYRERHQQKLSQGLESAFQEEIQVPTTTPAAAQRSSGHTQRQSSRLLKTAASIRSSPSSIPLSATEASGVNRRALASYPRTLAGGSNFTKSAVARRSQLDVPSPPKAAEAKEAICPYCFEVVDKDNMAGPLWTRHVLKDISPYVCLFEDCTRSTEQYQSLDDWIAHMQWQHTRKWSCQAPGHTQLRFDTSGECEAHMQEEHGENFSAAQVALLVEKSRHPAADPLEQLVRSENTDCQERSVCPLCKFAVGDGRIHDPLGLVPDTSVGIDGMKQMRDHIAGHLESIALLSLPERDEIDNAASNEVQSESAKVSSRGADSDRQALWQTSDAWNEYNLIRWNDETLLDNPDYSRAATPLGDDEDWVFVTSRTLAHAPPFDPGQDPVLLPFVERARRIQMLELQRRLGIPILVVSDPDGLEVPEGEWYTESKRLSSHIANTTTLPDVEPSSPVNEQRERHTHEAWSEFFEMPDSLQSGRGTGVQDLPTFALTEH